MNEILMVGDAYPTKHHSAAGRIYKSCGISPTLKTPQGGGAIPMIGVSISGVTINGKKDISNCLNANDQRKVFGANQDRTIVMDNNEEHATIDTEKYGTVSVRRLTPKECFRLQGWSDEMFERAATINSETQLYKQAGNGVTVSVIKAIARRLI